MYCKMSTICSVSNINKNRLLKIFFGDESENKSLRIKDLVSLLDKIKSTSSLENLEYSAQLSFIQYICIYCVKTEKGNFALAERILKDIHQTVYNIFDGNVTLTYGDVAESHAGMQQMGERAEKGFSLEDLMSAKAYFEEKHIETKIIHLNNFLPDDTHCEDDMKEKRELGLATTEQDKQAYVLIARDGVSKLVGSQNGESLLTEVLFYHWDAHFFNVKKKAVQNKNARSNLNFSVTRQVATYENYELKYENNIRAETKEGRRHTGESENRKVIPAIGTNVAFSDVPILNELRSTFADAIGAAADNLQCEGNLYNTSTAPSKATGIGYHGDTERRKVIGCRLGKKPMNMHFMWYYNNSPRGYNVSFTLNPGDLYIMSEKTVGTDWRPSKKMRWSSKSYVLRHAAGGVKYTSWNGSIRLNKSVPWKEDNDVNLASITHAKNPPKPKKGEKKQEKEWNNMPKGKLII